MSSRRPPSLPDTTHASPARRVRRAAPGLAVLIVLGLLAIDAFAQDGEQLTWSSATLVAPETLLPDATTGYRMNALSCPSLELCVAVDYDGNSLRSTNPAGGGGTWSVSPVDGERSYIAVACPTTTLCVAVSDGGDAIASTSNPTAERPSWTPVTFVDTWFTDVACGGPRQCVATTSDGDVLVSSEPTAGSGAWSRLSVDAASAPLNAIACPTDALCVAVDDFGNAVTTTSPRNPSRPWNLAVVAAGEALIEVTCPAPEACFAFDQDGDVHFSSAAGATTPNWRRVGNTSRTFTSSVACPSTWRCVGVDNGDATLSNAPMDPSAGWTATPLGNRLSAISCPTPTTCIVVDDRGHVFQGTGPAPTGTVEVSLGGRGSGTVTGPGLTCPPGCSGRYQRGSETTLTASAAPASRFAGWAGACTGTGACTFETGRVVSVTAIFEPVPPPPGFPLSISVAGPGRVSAGSVACPPACQLDAPAGSRLSLTAHPASGARFVRWGADCAAAAVCDLVFDGPRAVTALFERSSRTAVRRRARSVRVRLLRSKIDRRRRRATFRFASVPAGRATRCALVRRRANLRYPTARFARCRSPKSYARLRRGRYRFLVAAGAARPVVKGFVLR